MAGHSKWAQIKRKKAVKDKEKGKIFSKLSRLITIAVLEGGGVKLRLAIEHAKQANMPKENISRAVEKGTGPNKEQLKEVLYEGFGPEGTAFMILTTTDNSNRTFSEIRRVLDKQGGKTGAQGSVAYLFKKCASVAFDRTQNDENAVFAFADRVSAFDIEEDATGFIAYFPFEQLGEAEKTKGDLVFASPPELDFKPVNPVKLVDAASARRVLGLVENLENLDDVQRVYGNFDIAEEIAKGYN